METINGRFLPDDSDQSPRSKPDSGPSPRGSAEQDRLSSRRQRESNLPEPECTISSHRRGDRTLSSCGESDEPKRSSRGRADRYVELGELGRGGWGVVQRALDRQLQREVAVKRISNPGQLRPGELEQFLHEARITSGLQHPGVVPVHELVSDDGGDTYYVMKLLEGETLRHHIRLAHGTASDGGLKRHELVQAITPLLIRFIDVCHAVAYAHRCGIIHRDLKPSNIMAGAFGETIVVDWGLARYIEDQAEETTVQGPPGSRGTVSGSRSASGRSSSSRSSAPAESEGSVVGTPTYMAPEQARGELTSLGIHSDIYSLGVILYEIIAGTHPHKGMDLPTVLHRARSGKVTPLREIQPNVPKALQAIVETAMDPYPFQRYADVESLADDVSSFMTGQTVSVHRESVIERGVRWCGRHRAIAGTIAVAVTVLMIVSVVSTIVIRAAHRAELQAKVEARDAHHEALERLVESRDTADTWLVDLSGSLQFHPAMTPLRQELIQQALIQYGRLIEHPIKPLPDHRVAESDNETLKTHSLEWLERAKCHLRLGDLKRMAGKGDQSEQHYAKAEKILDKLQRNAMPVNLVSMTSDATRVASADWMTNKGSLEDLVRIEQINAQIGRALATESPPVPAQAIPIREQFQRWLPWQPPKGVSKLPTPFVFRVISAMVRFELVVGRTDDGASDHTVARSSNTVYSDERFHNAVQWARWMTRRRGNPSDLQLYDTIATDQAERSSANAQSEQAYQQWGELIDELERRVADRGERSDWIQAIAHAKIRRAEAAVSLHKTGQAAGDYAEAIEDLNRSWVLTDSDEFFRLNLATAEHNLATLWMKGDDKQIQQAKHLLLRSLAVYQQLLSESATPDLLKRLAKTHLAIAETIKASPSNGNDQTDERRQHLDNAKLAFEILKDQDFLTDHDHLDWAETLKQIAEIDPSITSQDHIGELLEQIDVDQLDVEERKRLQSLAHPKH